MSVYIATFFSHFGAIKFNKSLKENGINGVLMPVPRKLSSSCGTCVKFETDEVIQNISDDIETLFIDEGNNTYKELFSNM